MPHVDILSDWRSGGDARYALKELLAQAEQSPLLLDRITAVLRTEQLARDASDRAVAKTLGREWAPRPVPPLLRLVDGGRPTERTLSTLRTTAADPEGMAGWYPNLRGWEETDELGRARLLSDVDPDLALWDGRCWSGIRLDDAITEVSVRGFAAAMGRPRRLATRQQVVLLRYLAMLAEDVTPSGLAAAALLRERLEDPQGSWALHGRLVPAGVGAPIAPGMRSRVVDVLIRQPAGWYEVPGPIGPLLRAAAPDPSAENVDDPRAALDAALSDADTCLVRQWDGAAWTGPAVPGERTALAAPNCWTGWSVRPTEAPVAISTEAATSGAPWLRSLPWRLNGGEGAAAGSDVRFRPGELVRIVRTPATGGDGTRLSVHRHGASIELREDGTAVSVLADRLVGGQEAEEASAPQWIAALAAVGALDVSARTVVDIDVARHLLTGAVLEAVRLPGPEPLLEDLVWWQAEADEELAFELHHTWEGHELRSLLETSSLVSDRALRLDGDRIVWIDELGSGRTDDPAVLVERAIAVRLDRHSDGLRTVGDRLLAIFRMEAVGWFTGASGHLVDTSPSVLSSVSEWRGDFPDDISAWRFDPEEVVEHAAEWLVTSIAEQLDEFHGAAHLRRLLLDGTLGSRFTLVEGEPEAGVRAEYPVEVGLIGRHIPEDDGTRSSGRRRKRRGRPHEAGVPMAWSVVHDGVEIQLED